MLGRREGGWSKIVLDWPSPIFAHPTKITPHHFPHPKMTSLRRIGPFFCCALLLCYFFLIRNYANARMEILKKDLLDERSGGGKIHGNGTNSIQKMAPASDVVGLSSLPIDVMNVHGTVQEVALPDAKVHLESSITKVEIVEAKKGENEGRRKKREEAEGGDGRRMNDDEREERGLESIVDEVEEEGKIEEEEEEEGEKAKRPKKTFFKQAVKKEATGTKEKGGGGNTTADEKKKGTEGAKAGGTGGAGGGGTTAATNGGGQKGGGGGGGKNESEKEKAAGQSAPTGTMAAPKSTPAPSAAGNSTASKATSKDKPPVAQMPQGPPMPPPGAIPAPQIPQVQPPPAGIGNGSSQPESPTQSPSESARPSGKVANYKLIYFDARGICEPIRLLFHYAKVPFDDVRISRKQWLALKDSTVYGKVPILEVDGKPLTYCHTIARYLARQFGLAGRDSWEEAKVDEISDFHADVAMDLQPYMYVVAGFHQGDKNTLRQAIFLPNVEKHFPVYVNLLKLSGSGFFMPSGITWVDFVIAEYMTTVRHFEPQILDKYPAITKFVRKVQTQPQIFEYVTNREHQPVRK